MAAAAQIVPTVIYYNAPLLGMLFGLYRARGVSWPRLGGLLGANSAGLARPAELGYGGRENEKARYIFHTFIEHS